MPKEITHWIIAREALLALPNDTLLKKAIINAENLYFCASIIPDTPYYCQGRRGKPLRQAADRFHNEQRNSFAAFQQILSSPPLFPFDSELCAIAGTICHIIADATFHPLTCFLSGKESVLNKQKAIAKHRQFETSLDLFFLREEVPEVELLLSRYVAGLEIELAYLAKFLSKLLDFNHAGETALLVKAIKEHCFYQGLFNKNIPVLLLRFINLLRPNQMNPLLALSYVYIKQSALPFTSKPINYRHPVTGDPCKHRLSELKNDAVQKTVDIFRDLNRCRTREELQKLFQQTSGPNLVTGLLNRTNSDMRYFK